MIIDVMNMFSQAQAVTVTAPSTNSIDLGPLYSGIGGTNAGRNLGVGKNLYVVALLTAALVGAGATLGVTLETDSDPAFGTATTAQSLGTFAALSAAGTRLVGQIQPDAVNKRYLRAKYTVTSGPLTGGAVTTFFTNDIDAFTAYSDAFLID